MGLLPTHRNLIIGKLFTTAARAEQYLARAQRIASLSGVLRSAKTVFQMQNCRYHSKKLEDGKLAAKFQIGFWAGSRRSKQLLFGALIYGWSKLSIFRANIAFLRMRINTTASVLVYKT
jgi:hypothetical protein